MLRVALLLFLSVVSLPTLAAGSVSARVTYVRVDASGKGMVFFETAVGGAYATCRDSAYTNALSFDTNSAGGKALLALALSAKATGSVVSAIGYGTCNTYGGYAEDWNYGVAL